MKKFVLALITTLTFAFAILAQSPCPTVTVTGPSGLLVFGDEYTFTTNLSEEAKNYKIEYVWSVSNGEMAKGQGTPVIKVIQKPDLFGTTLTVTVEIKGLPKDCPSKASASGETCCNEPRSRKVAEYSINLSIIQKDKLEIFANELKNAPYVRGFIFEKFKHGTSNELIKKRVLNTYSYLVKDLGLDPFIIDWAIFEDEENLTEFWIVPPGANSPSETGKYKIASGDFQNELDELFPTPKKKPTRKKP